MVIVFIWSNRGLHFNDFNFYVIVKKNMLSLLSAIFLFCAIVLKVVKSYKLLRAVLNKSIFILVDNMLSTYFSRFVKTDWQIIHKKYWILTLQKHVPKELSLRMKEFRIFKRNIA